MQLFLLYFHLEEYNFEGDENPEVNELIGVFGSKKLAEECIKKSGLSADSFYIKECMLNIPLES